MKKKKKKGLVDIVVAHGEISSDSSTAIGNKTLAISKIKDFPRNRHTPAPANTNWRCMYQPEHTYTHTDTHTHTHHYIDKQFNHTAHKCTF